MRNPTSWFQLGIIGDAGPEIRNGLGAFLFAHHEKSASVALLLRTPGTYLTRSSQYPGFRFACATAITMSPSSTTVVTMWNGKPLMGNFSHGFHESRVLESSPNLSRARDQLSP